MKKNSTMYWWLIMRITIPAKDDKGLKSEVCEHFGRAKYFVFVDVQDDKIENVETVEVPFEDHSPGDLPNFIKEHGGELVLAYGIGRRAMTYFQSLGIQVVTGAHGKIEDVVKDFMQRGG
ncbi:NifB/NifX family molybdenum-iron cluster-binding protein [Thermococcus barophilus]|nr:NifB/NifX family molybdenum-iron cluster-binding protein [Thermococcus barophilus]